MFSSLSYTMSLMGASWQVLKRDKELLLFPLLSGLCCAAVMASFALPMFLTGFWEPPAEGAATAQQVLYYAVLFLFYVCNYAVIVFFNAAVVACAVIRLRGGDPTVADGLRAAAMRLPVILLWAVAMGTVGLLLRILEDRAEAVGRVVAGLLGAAWSVLTYLAVPVLVVEGVGPVEAFKRSAGMLRDTWGEQMVGRFSFGLVFFLLALPAAIPVLLGAMGGSAVSLAVGIGIAVLYLVILGLVQSVLMAIFQTALYLYARDGQAPAEFGGGCLEAAMRQARGG